MIGDEKGADSLPVALAGAVLLAAIITGMAALGFDNAIPAIETTSADGQAETLVNGCQLLISMAPGNLEDPGSPAGAMQTFDLDLPGGTEYLAFGFDPDVGGGNEGTIYYKVHGTKKALVVDMDVMFRKPGKTMVPEKSHMVLHAGRNSISIEYGRDAIGQRYLLTK